MEVSMSITRRGKYTNSNICINVQVRNVVCLFFLLYANLLVLVTLCEGNHYPFIEERYNNNFTSLCSTLHFYTISRPNSLIFRQNFFEKSSNGKSWVNTRTILTLLLKQGTQRRVLQHSLPSVSMGGHGSIQHYAHQGCWSFLPLCNPSFRAVRHISQNHFPP